MAKTRNRIATGLSIQDIMSMDMKNFESYSLKEQKELVSRLASAANKRYSKFEKKGVVNPAILKMQTEGGRISVKKKNADEIKEEYFRAKTFLKSKFSTQKGYKDYMKKLNESIDITKTGIHEGMQLSLLYSTAFAYYDVLEELSPDIQKLRDRYKITEKIAEYMLDGKDEQQIFRDIYAWLSKKYEETQEEFNKLSVSFGKKLDDENEDENEDEIPTRYKRKGLL